MRLHPARRKLRGQLQKPTLEACVIDQSKRPDREILEEVSKLQ